MPLGLGTWGPIAQATVPWDVEHDLLCSSPMASPMRPMPRTSASVEPRILQRISALRDHPLEEIVSAVMNEVDHHSAHPADDRTLWYVDFEREWDSGKGER